MNKTSANSPGRARSASIIASQKRAERRRRALIQAGVAIAAVVAVLGATIAILSGQDDAPPSAAPAGMTKDGGVLLGQASAPVTVTVIEDFGCPHCKAFEEETADLLDEYASGEAVNVEYRGIAFLDRAFSSDYSTRALNASACVAVQGPTTAWKAFHTTVFARQPAEGSAGLSDDELHAIATEAGASGDKLASCISDGTYDDWVKSTTDATLGHNGVQGTPAVLVDGTLVENPGAATISAAVSKAQGS